MAERTGAQPPWAGAQVNTEQLVSRARNVVRQSISSRLIQGVKAFSYHAGLYALRQQSSADMPIVLFYHKVQHRPVGVWGERVLDGEALEEHLSFLVREYQPIRLSELVEGLRGNVPLPPRAVALTFDDGYRNNLQVAAPILRRYRVPATVFVVTGLIGTDQWMWAYALEQLFSRYPLKRIGECSRHPVIAHLCSRGLDKRVAMLACVEYLKQESPEQQLELVERLRKQLPVELDEENRFLSWDEVRRLRDVYDFEIGAHTETHAILPLVSPEQAEWELRTCRDTLERQLGTRPTLFAYPNGDTSPSVNELVGRYFTAAFTTCPSACTPALSPLELPRIGAPVEVSDLAFQLTLQHLQAPPPRVLGQMG